MRQTRFLVFNPIIVDVIAVLFNSTTVGRASDLNHFASGLVTHDMSRDMTKQTKFVCAKRRLRSAWADAQTDLSSLGEHSFCWLCHVRRRMPAYTISSPMSLWVR